MLLVLIFAVILISGLVAYIGDQIGMKVGKKRLSLFGIRPKYTSIIITVLTGIIIATLSITLLLIASRGVRMAVFDMQKLVAELTVLNRQVSEKDKFLKEMAEKVTETTALLADMQVQKERFQTELDEKEAQLAKKQAEYKSMENRLKKAHDDYDHLARTNMELEKSIANLDQKILAVEQQKMELDEQKVTLEKEIVALQNDIHTLTEEVAETTATAQKLQTKVINMEMNTYAADMIFKKGQLIYMESLDTLPGGTRTELSAAINAFLERANRYVKQLKLRVSENENGLSIKIPTEQAFDISMALANGQNDKILVGIYANQNIWPNDFVEASITWEKNYRVYYKNEVIIQKEMDSALKSSSLEAQIRKILQDISERSRDRGLLPNSNGEVGEVTLDEILKIVEKIRGIQGKVKVIVQATRDIWREETLTMENLRFDVLPIEVR